MVHLSIVLDDERLVSVDVDGGETVSTLKAILEAETGIPASEQLLSCTGKGLADGQSLAASSVTDGDLLVLARQGGAADGAPPQSHPMAVDQNGNVVNPQAMLDAIRGNPEIMSQLATGNAPLHEAIRAGDIHRMAELMREVHTAREAEAAARRQAEADLWNADPFDPEAQARIAERIQQEHIAHNYEQAYENNPEVFVQVDMLYVNLEINRHTVAAFVDSGAQMTIISLATAERLGLMHLLDKRFGGMAKGVGTGKILGRIHQAMMKVGDEFLATQLTVMENNDMPFLFGLDMLRRHQCQIDLKANVLRFTNLDVALPFLQPHELPAQVRGTVGAPQAAQQSGDAAGPSQPTANPRHSASASAAAGAAAAARAAAGAPVPGAAAPTPAVGRSAPHPAAAQQTAAPPPAVAGSGDGGGGAGASAGDDAKLQQLTGLGFSRQQAQEALEVCGGDVDRAASFLFESSMGF